MSDPRDMEAVFEAILFVSHDPISPKRLLEIFGERERDQARQALDAVVERLSDNERGFRIDEVAGGLRLVTRPDLHPWLKRFFEASSARKLSMAALETLAIIAYRQPITAPEIQELRNVNSSGALKKLLERRLVRIAGRKEVVGKPFLYATTREFLMHFGLKSLKELPPLEQFEEMFGDELEGWIDGPAEPDAEETVEREAAALTESEDEAAEKAEREAIEAERAAAEAREAAEPVADPEDGARADGTVDEAGTAADARTVDPAAHDPADTGGEAGQPDGARAEVGVGP